MKTPIFRHKWAYIFPVILLSLTISGFGQLEASKTINESYDISHDYTLAIENAYGSIEIVNWDKDQLTVEVLIEVKAATQAKADKALDAVAVIIDESGESVSFETEFDRDLLGKKTNITISYKVQAPSYLNVDLEQSYGNIFIQELTGNVNCEVKYGNFDAGSIENVNTESRNSLDIDYANASIEKAGFLSVEISYGELSISESSELSIESKYSKLDLGIVGLVDIESKYDKIKIESLEKDLLIKSKYSHISIASVAKDFSEISAEMTYGNFKGALESGASFEISAHLSYGNIQIPDGELSIEHDNSNHSVNGRVGKGPGGKVFADMKYGNFILK